MTPEELAQDPKSYPDNLSDTISMIEFNKNEFEGWIKAVDVAINRLDEKDDYHRGKLNSLRNWLVFHKTLAEDALKKTSEAINHMRSCLT